jgi:hypothetical protein
MIYDKIKGDYSEWFLVRMVAFVILKKSQKEEIILQNA